MRSVFISVVFRIYLATIVPVKTQPMCGLCHNSGGLLKFSEFLAVCAVQENEACTRDENSALHRNTDLSGFASP